MFTVENALIDSNQYKFIWKGKMASGILIGKGTYVECQEIINILTRVNCSKKEKLECKDVKLVYMFLIL